MARIIYGVCGEGMGHAMRSKPILDYLTKKHQVRIFSSKGAFSFLSKNYRDVKQVQGVYIKYKNNRVARLWTIFHNLSNALRLIRSYREVKRAIKEFRPDIIISDYEITTAYGALLNRIPLISIDNQHIIRGNVRFPRKFLWGYVETVIVNRLNIPTADNYITTTFFNPGKIPKNTQLVPPIIRDAVLKAKAKSGKPIMVYQTSDTNKKLIQSLKEIDHEFVVSGFNKEKKEGNIQFITFNEKKFLKHLAGCKAIITNGGFTLITEALHLGKPILSVPVVSQFEQTLNAVHLDRMRFGKFVSHASKENIEEFIRDMDKYRRNIKRYKRQDNSEVLKKIKGIIDEACSQR